MNKFAAHLALFAIGMVVLGFFALLDGALVMWMIGHIFPQFGYWDWFWMNFALMMPVGTAVGYGLAAVND